MEVLPFLSQLDQAFFFGIVVWDSKLLRHGNWGELGPFYTKKKQRSVKKSDSQTFCLKALKFVYSTRPNLFFRLHVVMVIKLTQSDESQREFGQCTVHV